MSADIQKPIPRATYRLQFNKDFGFRDAAALAPYLARLGISHVYASPYLKARPGSTHGYDIVDHNSLNPELGNDSDFEAMCATFREHGLGQILDFVPNHMGIGGSDNPFWLDVLEWGPDSRYADWFDIDWEPESRYLQNRLLVHFLGDQYGAVLESGSLILKFDATDGSFAVWAYDTHKLPLSPPHYAEIVGPAHPDLERIGDAFAHLSTSRHDVMRRSDELKAELAKRATDEAMLHAVEEASAAFKGSAGDLSSWTRLDKLIQKQFWRPAHFRVAADDINYRRFFNVNDLAGIRIEATEVFERVHRLVLRLLNEGMLDGLRLDHIDGLLDPKAYCLQLREAVSRPFFLLVEKILAPHESLRDDWDVDGTTGYEFTNLITSVLVDPAGEGPLTEAYDRFTGSGAAFDEIVRTSKLQIMENEMASELNVLARAAARVARSHPSTADFTNNVLRRALKQIIACFPVYRTYVDADGATETDRRDIDWALAKARRFDTGLDPSVFDFLHKLLTMDLVATPLSGFSHRAVTRAAMRAQQYSGPVMAKGLEDTAFYRYNRLLALNEVGGSPDRFGVSIAQFHAANTQRARRTPHAMLSTSTHDTKRGEDARARLAALSEISQEWADRVPVWSRILRARSADATEDVPPDRHDEYAFYQLLLAAWPPELLTELDPVELERFRRRMETAMLKSVREAKVHTTWALPNPAYEDAVIDFVRYALDGSRTNAFLESFLPVAARVAQLGVWNSLVQTALKLTAPGVPDIYQGAELWDLNLVDPDNRRAVDFEARRRLLGRIDTDGSTSRATELQSWHDGSVKLGMISTLLELRRRLPKIFALGSYEPLPASGAAADRVIAFMRHHEDGQIIVAALRFPARGMDQLSEDLVIELPGHAGAGPWLDVVAGKLVHRIVQGQSRAGDLFGAFPVVVLVEAPSG
jgi:(1->4)-alpha-D-glucan 1-alpha-D-glucosylmutase